MTTQSQLEKKDKYLVNLLQWIRKIESKKKLEDFSLNSLKTLLVEFMDIRQLHHISENMDLTLEQKSNPFYVLTVKLMMNYELRIMDLIVQKTKKQQEVESKQRERIFKDVSEKALIISNEGYLDGAKVLFTKILPSRKFLEQRLAIGLGPYVPFTHVVDFNKRNKPRF